MTLSLYVTSYLGDQLNGGSMIFYVAVQKPKKIVLMNRLVDYAHFFHSDPYGSEFGCDTSVNGRGDVEQTDGQTDKSKL